MRFRPCPQLDGSAPLDVLARWPRERPLAMLHSHAASDGRWAVLACPRGSIEVSAQHGRWIGPPQAAFSQAARAGIAAALTMIEAHAAEVDVQAHHPPFAGWMVCLQYELGHVLEPAAGPRATDSPAVAQLLHCPDGWVHDGQTGRWWAMGDPPTLGEVQSDPLRATGPVISTPPADGWPELVARAIEYIHAGDIFQVNLCRQLRVPIAGSPRSFALAALREPQTTFGACIEIPGQDCTLVSLSPELFLHADTSGLITSRPIKGTLPASCPAGDLLESDKDAAELHMIVDLMRNDLGRVCEPGSVRVTCPRRIESHATVHHGVAEVQGQLRGEVGLVDLLRATFPAGSITGAPKIRAMQIAASLEPRPRGFYCGAIGMLGPQGQVSLSVAIRTAVIGGGHLQYGVGCGIVADSNPLTELAESEAKAAVLWNCLGDELNPPCESPSGVAAGQKSPA